MRQGTMMTRHHFDCLQTCLFQHMSRKQTQKMCRNRGGNTKVTEGKAKVMGGQAKVMGGKAKVMGGTAEER